MQEFQREVKNISTLIPQVESDIIMDFMRNIPDEVYHLRIPLTLSYFYNLEEKKDTLKTAEENRRYAHLIHDLFPMYSVYKISEKLKKFGNIPDRYRLVLRNILKGTKELGNAMMVTTNAFEQKHNTHSIPNESCNGRLSDTEQLENDILQYGLNDEDQNKDFDQNFRKPTQMEESLETIIDTSVDIYNPDIEDQILQREEEEEESKLSCEYETSEFPSNQIMAIEPVESIQRSVYYEPDHPDPPNYIDPPDVIVAPSLRKGIDPSLQEAVRSMYEFEFEQSDRAYEPAEKRSKKDHDAEIPGPPMEESVNSAESKSGEVSMLPLTAFPSSSAATVHRNVLERPPTEESVNSAESKSGEVCNLTLTGVPFSSAATVDGNVKPIDIDEYVTNNAIYRVMAIFEDADPDYLRRLYHEVPSEATSESVIIDAIIEKVLETGGDYPKRVHRAPTPEAEVDVDSQIAFISELLPDADPNFLSMKVNELSPDELKTFIAEAIETKDYPTKKEYLRKQQLSAQMRQYTTEFTVENFVKMVPDPIATFEDPKRKIQMDNDDIFYLTLFLKNEFSRIAVRSIQKVLMENNRIPYKCVKILRSFTTDNMMKTKRHKMVINSIVCKNIPLLQEIAFIEHEKAILDHINRLKLEKEQERVRAKENGLMVTCNCCFDEEVMPNESHTCSNNCIFCKECITRSTEVAFGEGRLEFPCLGNCGSQFTLQALQDVLPPNLFSKIAQKKAVAEVKAAGIEDLEFCPFCDFATIPPSSPETDRIFRCQNPECLKESCRLCKEPSHVPLRCDEVEKDLDVKNRVYIENKMTEALLRKCWKCGVSFYKEEGCNKMTCSCGAHTCYICGAAVTDYQHFNGIGGDKFHLCPLYSDTIAVNHQNVLEGAKKAKEEIGVASTSSLKIDPTADVEKHFRDRASKVPKEPHVQQLQMLNQQAGNRIPENIINRVENVRAGVQENLRNVDARLQEVANELHRAFWLPGRHRRGRRFHLRR